MRLVNFAIPENFLILPKKVRQNRATAPADMKHCHRAGAK
jgi:hypothetical protein